MELNVRTAVDYTAATATYTWLNGPRYDTVLFVGSKLVTDSLIAPAIEDYFKDKVVTEIVTYTLEDLFVGLLTAFTTNPHRLFSREFYRTILYATTASQIGKISRELMYFVDHQ